MDPFNLFGTLLKVWGALRDRANRRRAQRSAELADRLLFAMRHAQVRIQPRW